MKLYKRIPRLLWRKEITRKKEKLLKWALSLKPGMMINSCSGFNGIIKDIEIYSHKIRKGWFIYDVHFQLVNADGELSGYCSLMNCGVQPAKSPEEIEQWFKRFYQNLDPKIKEGWHYCSDKDLIWVRMQNNLPLCDKKGLRTNSIEPDVPLGYWEGLQKKLAEAPMLTEDSMDDFCLGDNDKISSH